MKKTQQKSVKTRRLSIPRLVVVVLGCIGAGYWLLNTLTHTTFLPSGTEVKPWFGAYIDVTATPRYAFEELSDAQYPKNLVLSFIVSDKSNACTAAWGGEYTLDEANRFLDLDRRIARTRQLGGHISISFGGQLNDELSINCIDKDKLRAAYKSVFDRYNIDTIDLDIEGEDLTNTQAMSRRAEVIKYLQQELRDENRNLAIWLTLPVTPQGLSQDGINAVQTFLEEGVDITGINIMTMDYGQSKDTHDTMQKASEKALNETHRQIQIVYKQKNITLNNSDVWKKLGATVMIGQNDFVDEIFTLNDAQGFNEFARSKGLARLSIWSGNRDVQCGDNYVNTSKVSVACSGVDQQDHEFSQILGEGFYASITTNASVVTTESPEIIEVEDSPDESPYQIWTEEGTYLEGTKVVWHRNVYEAKWWTQGDMPDNPVLQSWETPWQLIGPVLPGEKPIPQPTLPPGIYSEWSGTRIYEAGDRILFAGTPYQAKWWTQGDSPAASSSSPDSSPWTPLTRAEIEKILLN